MSTKGKNSTVKQAGIIIIGDEVLKGQVADLNTYYLCKEFYSLGVKVRKVSVIGDGLDEISNEVKKFSDRYDFVVTTGGVGPTHDDITYEGVAKAFNEELVRNNDMAVMIDKWLGHKNYSLDVIMRMAQMPASSKLIFDPDKQMSSFPIVNVRNVYIFPGIPAYLKKLFPRLQNIFKGNLFHNDTIYVARDEISITPQLDEAVNKFKDRVVFGSYPVIGNLYYSTRLTMEGMSAEIIKEANSFLSKSLPAESIVNYDSEPLESAMGKVYAISEDKEHPLHVPVKTSIQIIEECLSQYNVSNICICFNGGKDCTALLHILYAVLQKASHKNAKIPALCIQNQDQFPEMEDFIRETSSRYNLDLRIYNGPIIAGLKEALNQDNGIEAVLMGTRRSDPSGRVLNHFQMTDSGWPKIMRVSPILDWTYKQVWDFLRLLSLPYCSLYDKGFSSSDKDINIESKACKAIQSSDGTRVVVGKLRLE